MPGIGLLAYRILFVPQADYPRLRQQGLPHESIKKYFRALIDVDRSAIEHHFPGFNVAQVKRSMVHEIIDWRKELYRLYVK